MNTLFSDRILRTQKSFIREILKVTENPRVISFAGGLPNSRFFPVKEIKDAASKVLEEYSTLGWIMEGLIERAQFHIDNKEYYEGFMAVYECIKC
jgi:DNA-binding transcriptional MocR family regulator